MHLSALLRRCCEAGVNSNSVLVLRRYCFNISLDSLSILIFEVSTLWDLKKASALFSAVNKVGPFLDVTLTAWM
jgi:hypothetical protein